MDKKCPEIWLLFGMHIIKRVSIYGNFEFFSFPFQEKVFIIIFMVSGGNADIIYLKQLEIVAKKLQWLLELVIIQMPTYILTNLHT